MNLKQSKVGVEVGECDEVGVSIVGVRSSRRVVCRGRRGRVRGICEDGGRVEEAVVNECIMSNINIGSDSNWFIS